MLEERLEETRRRVLVVDGDPAFAAGLTPEFQGASFDVETVSTAAEAMARVAAAPPDLVVLDPFLPERAAVGLLRLWKQSSPAMTVLLVSGHASLNVVVDALKEGAREFFTKPVSVASLLAALDAKRALPLDAVSPGTEGGAGHHLGFAGLSAEGVDRFFSVSPGLLAVMGFDGYFKLVNPAWEKVLGHTIEELCARPCLDLVHPDDKEKATDEAFEIRGGHTVFHFKNRYRCHDGSYRWLAWSATPSPAQGLIYAVARDVTNSVRMEQGLRRSNERLKDVVHSGEKLLRQAVVKTETLVETVRFKDEITEMIVHDLKNPLAIIVSNYEYILDGFEGSADALQALQDSQQAGRRMVRLLANLLDVAHFEDGALEVRPTTTTVSQFLQPILSERRVMAFSKEVRLTLVSSSDITMNFDTDLLTRVVENILDNALRYTPMGGTIEAETRQVGASVEIRIGNSGDSIPVELRSTIFEKYRQHGLNGRMNLGLGLYFCRMAVEAHGGTLSIDETPRLPTVFVVKLPAFAPVPGVGPTSVPLVASPRENVTYGSV